MNDEVGEFGATRHRCPESGAELAPESLPFSDGLAVAYSCPAQGTHSSS